jgi:hypothetical protein
LADTIFPNPMLINLIPKSKCLLTHGQYSLGKSLNF